MWLLKPFSSMCIIVAEKNHVNIKINVPLFAILRPEPQLRAEHRGSGGGTPRLCFCHVNACERAGGLGSSGGCVRNRRELGKPQRQRSLLCLPAGRQQVLQNLNCSSRVTVLEEDSIPCSQAAPGLVQRWRLENKNKKYHGVCAHVLCAGFLWLPLLPSAVVCDAQNEGCFSHQVDTGSTGSRCGLGHCVCNPELRLQIQKENEGLDTRTICV